MGRGGEGEEKGRRGGEGEKGRRRGEGEGEAEDGGKPFQFLTLKQMHANKESLLLH